jgi:signal transduction histidine kinase
MAAGSGFLQFIRQPMVRLALLFSALFGLSTMALFAFIYWQTAVLEISRVDRLLVLDVDLLVEQSPDARREIVMNRVMPNLRRLAYAGIYDHEKKLAGNFPYFPAELPLDGVTRPIVVDDPDRGLGQNIRAVGRPLEDGTVLVIGRNIDSLENLRLVVIHALELGLIPAMLLALITGILVSQRTRRQLQQVHATAERIIKGDLRERLPTRGGGDDFDRLAGSVNHMLDLIARLMDDMKSVGDNIAHDIRTPLTRVRTRLERARDTAQTQEEWQDMVDRAVAGLDQALRLTTALLRIGEIEGGRRRAGFEQVDLELVAREIAELYEPIAEEKGLSFALDLTPTAKVAGDRDLLSELLSNLVDNAIKFTPGGGKVGIVLRHGVLEVRDSGPGIPPSQHEAVFQRFYRTDASRSVEGYGLGLSLVDAIVKLHGFRLTILDNAPGCVFRLEADHPSSNSSAPKRHARKPSDQ